MNIELKNAIHNRFMAQIFDTGSCNNGMVVKIPHFPLYLKIYDSKKPFNVDVQIYKYGKDTPLICNTINESCLVEWIDHWIKHHYFK